MSQKCKLKSSIFLSFETQLQLHTRGCLYKSEYGEEDLKYMDRKEEPVLA